MAPLDKRLQILTDDALMYVFWNHWVNWDPLLEDVEPEEAIVGAIAREIDRRGLSVEFREEAF